MATLASPKYLEINSDTQINGSLAVKDNINGLNLEASPSANSFKASSGTSVLTVSGSSLINQDLSTSSNPSFTNLNL